MSCTQRRDNLTVLCSRAMEIQSTASCAYTCCKAQVIDFMAKSAGCHMIQKCQQERNELGISRQQAEHLRIWSLPAVMLHQSPTACERSALPHWCGSSEQASAGSQAGLACLQHSITHFFIHQLIHPSICSFVGLIIHSFVHASNICFLQESGLAQS